MAPGTPPGRALPGSGPPGSVGAAFGLVVGAAAAAGCRPAHAAIAPGHWQAGAVGLPHQPAPGGGTWVQLAMPAGLAAVPLHRSDAALAAPAGVQQSVQLEIGEERWWLSNGLLRAEFGPGGLQQLWGGDGVAQLRGPLAWCRWGDHGEFWDAWDIAADYRSSLYRCSGSRAPTWQSRGRFAPAWCGAAAAATAASGSMCSCARRPPGWSSVCVSIGSNAMNCCVWSCPWRRRPAVTRPTPLAVCWSGRPQS